MFHKKFRASLFAQDTQIREWGHKVGMEILENMQDLFEGELNQNPLSII